MELALNFAWFVLAAVMFCVWWQLSPRWTSSSRQQLVALALVVIILLPVISVTDDLLAAQNPAEIDVCLRRGHDWLDAHMLIPMTPALVPALLASITPARLRRHSYQHIHIPDVREIVIASIENRPPPCA